MWFSALELLVSRKRWAIRRLCNSYTSFRLVPRSTTLTDIWRSFQPMFSFPPPISRKLYTIRSQKLKLLIRNHTTAFSWYDCRWPWRYFIRLFHIKFLVNGAWYGKSYYRLRIRNHALLSIGVNFDDLEGHLKVISIWVVISTSISAIFGRLSRRAVAELLVRC